ncbi:lipid droplet-associated perilipin protein [Pholiota molesta]|nr:lipid droplet-associated perilipin protein [Pholiota molesta]
MSTTATETAPAPAQTQAPEVTVLSRVASIPMISSSLNTINEALSSNTYTRSPYAHAKELSSSAYKFTEPLQVKLAPLIVRADGYANKAVDAVESRYPYPFKAQPEEVATLVRERKESTTNYVSERVNDVNKAIDANVKTPALNVAHDIDQRFAPIVDYFAGAVNRLNSSEAGPSTPPDAQYQYQRALALSKTLRENLYEYSNEQLKQLQAQSVIAQKASETAHSISAVASSSFVNAQTRIHGLSDTMLAELQRLQTSTTELSASLQNTLQSSAAQVQSQVPQIQQSYADLTGAISSTVNELSSIITTKDLPLQDKVTRVSKEVQDRVQPLLDAVRKGVSEVLARKEASAPAGATNGTSGHAPVEPVTIM